MRTANEIRSYFLDMLNKALEHLGMYGGEGIAADLISHLAFIDDREAELRALDDALEARGPLTSKGVTGAFKFLYPELEWSQWSNVEVWSVYAELAFQMSYLATNRVLDRQEFESLKAGLRKLCRTQDFIPNQVQKRFGTPSWRAGTNPTCPWVYLYITNVPKFSTIAFDFGSSPEFVGEIVKGQPWGETSGPSFRPQTPTSFPLPVPVHRLLTGLRRLASLRCILFRLRYG